MNPFVRPRRVDRPALRLICFHHAGGSAAVYHPLARHLPEDWEVLLLDLPGHGRRHDEPLRRDMEQVIAGVVRDVRDHTGARFALFGHSMGAVVAAEVGRRLTDAGRPPVWVGVSGRAAPSAQRESGLWRLPDPELFATLVRLGGTPEQLVEYPELRELFLRVVRADLEAVDSYRPDPGRSPLSCRLTAFGGLTDPWAEPDSLSGWERETRAGSGQCFFPGGHFYFLDSGFGPLAREIRTEIHTALSRTNDLATAPD